MKKSTYVYIDGFNLYYRLRAVGSAKWLDLRRFTENILNLDRHEIKKIKYFTAKVKKNGQDPNNTIRQNAYLRAIRELPDVEIILGKFKMRKLRGVLCGSTGGTIGKVVTIEKYEEKTSDVNLAVHMVADGYENKYDCAVLISNDADLVPPLLYIKNELRKTVVVISPYKTVNADLRGSSSFAKTIATGRIFKNSQLPETVGTPQGDVHRPKKWT